MPSPKVSKYAESDIYTAVEATHILGATSRAEKVTGIPDTTIDRWMVKEEQGKLDEFVEAKARDRVTGSGEGEQVSSTAEQLNQLRIQKRLQYLELAWEVVSLGLEQLKKVLPESKSVKDIATTLGIITDKILLMQGEANRRTETTSQVKRDDLLDVAKQAGIEAAKVVQQDEVTPKRKQQRKKAV